MQGLMMDYQLTHQPLLERAQRLYPTKEVVAKGGPNMERSNWGTVAERVGRLSNALARLGVKPGDRVATFAWNNTRHLELYFAIPNMGAVLHPLNLRLPPDQLAYIVQHADDQVLFVDPSLVPAVERLAPLFKTVKQYVIMAEALRQTSLSPVYSYEELLRAESADVAWPKLDENSAAAMCYTSGTTGNPKGVVYSHRALYLHSMGLTMSCSFGMSEADVFLPVVPMFHVLAWGTPFVCAMLGLKVVFPGPHLTPPDLAGLIQGGRVTITAGVPTLWLGLLALLEKEPYDLSSLRAMIVGGAAAPQSMIENYQKKHGLKIVHAWGMTEMSPLGTVGNLKSYHEHLPEAEKYALRAKQGLPGPGVEVRALDVMGAEIPWAGNAFGEVECRGASI